MSGSICIINNPLHKERFILIEINLRFQTQQCTPTHTTTSTAFSMRYSCNSKNFLRNSTRFTDMKRFFEQLCCAIVIKGWQIGGDKVFYIICTISLETCWQCRRHSQGEWKAVLPRLDAHIEISQHEFFFVSLDEVVVVICMFIVMFLPMHPLTSVQLNVKLLILTTCITIKMHYSLHHFPSNIHPLCQSDIDAKSRIFIL